MVQLRPDFMVILMGEDIKKGEHDGRKNDTIGMRLGQAHATRWQIQSVSEMEAKTTSSTRVDAGSAEQARSQFIIVAIMTRGSNF